MIVKVCGMRDPDNIRAVAEAGADWMGFIFYPRSPRCFDRASIPLPDAISRVGTGRSRSMNAACCGKQVTRS